jgi:geranylgeranyl pyrophosphate synthase
LATPAQAKQLGKLWGNRTAGLPELEQVRQLLHDCGAQAKTAQQANAHLQDSLEVLDGIPLAAAAKSELARLAHFCVSRQH